VTADIARPQNGARFDFCCRDPRFRLAFAVATQSPRSETAVVASVLLPSGQATENIAYFLLILIASAARRSESTFIA
jgi:hypothetical protein